ncbi:MAG TPA: cbb3-type cytochrome c oxidase subunit I [Nitrososphaeraceae archaeon]|nr:cbb3-type cytochrome c oxidase subunit I [Nitrososphaeraceae archaeon]
MEITDKTMLHLKYEEDHGPAPEYKISKDLSDLTLMFIISSIVYFIAAGALAIVMRLVQSGIMILGNQQSIGLFYTALTVHGQVMFFGFMSMLTVGISYYLLSKFAKKPIYSMTLATISFSLLNAGTIFLLVSGTMFFGAGWYNLMPLTFQPGNAGWNTLSGIIFLMADVMIAIGLVIFCLVVIATVFKGKIAAGIQKSEKDQQVADYDDRHKNAVDPEDSGRIDLLPMVDIPSSTRLVSALGLSSWFPIKYRRALPAVSVVVVGVFVNATALLSGSVGLFAQLGIGFAYVLNPNFDPNWLLAKDAWWFFGHPIVYFTLFSFLGAAYYYIPRYAKKTVPYDKWAYRSWPFYFVFTVLVFTHHTYMDMPNPDWLKMLSQAATFGVIFPSALTIMTIMMYVFRSKIKWNLSSMFIMAGFVGWAIGGFTGAETGWWGTNVYLHNTLNIVGHIHLVLLVGSVLFGLGLIYSIIPDLTRRKFNITLGRIHLILTVVGGFGLALLFTYLGFAGFIRREAAVPAEFAWAMPWLFFFAATVGIGQLVFTYNLFRTLKGERRLLKNNGLYYAAATSTALAGILHLLLMEYFVGVDSLTSVFFIISGAAQIFWAVPYIRRWSRLWYIIGIFGTLVLIVLFVGNQAETGKEFDWKFVLLYLVVGAAQLFWIIPLIKRWTRLRFYVGIILAASISIFWIITYPPEAIRGVEAPYDDLSIIIESLQVVFIMTSAAVLIRGGFLWPRNVQGSPTRILILGSGFGGIEVLKNLLQEHGDDRTIQITLVSRENFILFTPMLADVATGLIENRHIITPVRSFCKNATFYQASVEKIDLDNKRVNFRYMIGNKKPATHDLQGLELDYDYLVMALGNETNFFGNKNIERCSFTMKTIDDAIALRNHVISMLEQANLQQTDRDLRRSLMTFVVVGGGFSGIETAGSINDFVRESIKKFYKGLSEFDASVIVVNSHDVILPEAHQELGRFALEKMREKGIEFILNSHVIDVTSNNVKLDNGTVISSHTVVWTAGISPSQVIQSVQCDHDRSGRILTNSYLEVDGRPGVYALGDCASVPDPYTGKFYAPLAQHAIREGKVVARNISSSLKGMSERYVFDYKTRGMMAEIGTKTGVAILFGFKLHGFIAWLIWRSYYLANLPTLRKKARVLSDWTMDMIVSPDVSMIKSYDMEKDGNSIGIDCDNLEQS